MIGIMTGTHLGSQNSLRMLGTLLLVVSLGWMIEGCSQQDDSISTSQETIEKTDENTSSGEPAAVEPAANVEGEATPAEKTAAPKDADKAAVPVDADLAGLEKPVREQILKARDNVRQNPDSADALGILGVLYQIYGMNEAAESAYAAAIEKAPDNFRWHYYLAYVLLNSGKYADAVGGFEKAVKLEPYYLPAKVSLGIAQLRSGEQFAAIDTLKPLREAHPDDPMINYVLGIAYKEAGEFIWAVEYLKPLLDKNPQFGGVRAALAASFKGLGQEDTAAGLVEGWPLNADIPILRDPVYGEIYRFETGTDAENRRGIGLLGGGLPEKAIKHFEKALEFDPESRIAKVGRIDCLTAMEKYEEAEAVLKDILKVDDRDLPALVRLGHLYIAQSKYDDVQPVLKKAVSIDSDNTTVLTMLVKLAMKREKYDDAVTHLKRIVEILQTNGNAYCELGKALILTGDDASAEQAFLKSLEYSPDNLDAAKHLAYLYGKAGKNEAAAYWGSKLLLAGTGTVQEYQAAASTTLRKKDYATGMDLLRRGIELYPDDVVLNDMLSRVYSMCPDARYRDWSEAIRIAEKIYGTDENEISVQGLSTLAAAHAEAENYQEAIRLTKAAIIKASDMGDDDIIGRLSQSLTHYRQDKKIYEEAY